MSVREGSLINIEFTNDLGNIYNKNVRVSNCGDFRGPLNIRLCKERELVHFSHGDRSEQSLSL